MTKENAERFTGRTEAYARYRERYDAELLLDRLRAWCGMTEEWVIADIASGTGMLADVFLANGQRVIAVEPNAEMREACARLHEDEALLTIAEGTAERTGLERGSIDLVSVGRALHWFDVDAAMVEFERILRPQGWVAIVAAGRAEMGTPENEALEDLLRSGTPGYRSTRESYAVYRLLPERFAGRRFHNEGIEGEMGLRWEELRGLVLSLSHAPLPESPGFAEFEARLRALFERYAKDGVFALRTCTWINVGQVR